MKYGLIYRATNILNNKCYIGKTLGSFQKRKRDHIRCATTMQKRHYKFYNALRKYGIENFIWETLKDNIAEDQLDWHETWFIVTFDTKINGYNSTWGGLDETNLSKGRLCKNRIPWNKGLTVQTDARVSNLTKKMKETKHNNPHFSAPENKNITKELLYDCVVNKKMSRKETAIMLNTNERLIKKWKHEWHIYSPNNGRIQKGQHLSVSTEIKKGQRLNSLTKFEK